MNTMPRHQLIQEAVTLSISLAETPPDDYAFIAEVEWDLDKLGLTDVEWDLVNHTVSAYWEGVEHEYSVAELDYYDSVTKGF